MKASKLKYITYQYYNNIIIYYNLLISLINIKAFKINLLNYIKKI